MKTEVATWRVSPDVKTSLEREARRRKISMSAALDARGTACGSVMAGDALIDTGAILALLDRTDRWHKVCVDAFQQLRLPLVTSQAVLAELFHLVDDSRHEMETA